MVTVTAQAANAYLNQSAASLAPKESDLSMAVGDARAVGKMLEEIRSEVTDLSVRLGGPMSPTDEAESEREGFREGLVGDVRRALGDARVTAFDTLSLLRRIRSVV